MQIPDFIELTDEWKKPRTNMPISYRQQVVIDILKNML